MTAMKEVSMSAATMMDTVCMRMERLLFFLKEMHMTTMMKTRQSTPARMTPTKGQKE